jgi:hypothetical protein
LPNYKGKVWRFGAVHPEIHIEVISQRLKRMKVRYQKVKEGLNLQLILNRIWLCLLGKEFVGVALERVSELRKKRMGEYTLSLKC